VSGVVVAAGSAVAAEVAVTTVGEGVAASAGAPAVVVGSGDVAGSSRAPAVVAAAATSVVDRAGSTSVALNATNNDSTEITKAAKAIAATSRFVMNPPWRQASSLRFRYIAAPDGSGGTRHERAASSSLLCCERVRVAAADCKGVILV